MITIVDIVEQIKNKKDTRNSVIEDKNAMEWKPQECVDYVLPPFEIQNVRSKKQAGKGTGIY